MRHCQPAARAVERVYGVAAAGLLAGHGHRAIAGQPVGPVVVAGLQRLLDQQAAESRAIDEQVAGDARAGLQRHRLR